jgi:hypothetical protein
MTSERAESDGARIASLRELLMQVDARESLPATHQQHPRGFAFDGGRRTLDIYWPGYLYWIDLDRISTPEQTLGWIRHLSKRNWQGMTAERIGNLIEALARRKDWQIHGM